MSNYVVQQGDTFTRISQRVYGHEGNEPLLKQANPGVVEPLQPGTIITTPRDTNAPTPDINIPLVTSENEVAITIDGERFRFWESVNIQLSIDAIASITFTAPFQPDEIVYREAFRPFTYKPVVITVGGKLLFTGVMMPPVATLESARRSVTVEAYALPGVLQDCTAPSSMYPLEFNDQGLREIAEILTRPFGLDVELEGDQGSIFKTVSLEPNTKILSFLSKLAKQRNRVLSSTPAGNLSIVQSVDTGNPVSRLREGAPPIDQITPIFTGQQYFSSITGIEPAIVGIPGEKFTQINDRLSGVVRPLTFTANDSNSGDVKQAVNARMGRMFAGAVSYDVKLATWRDVNNELWTPNTTVTLIAPGSMIYTEYEFLIRGVQLVDTNDGQSALLELVMPGAFDGKIPGSLPWDE